MAYDKQTWNNDDPDTPLSASRLNHIEDGIAEKAERGPKGDKGDDGPQGPPGEDGTNGSDGAKGAKGEDGADGFGTEAQYDKIISRLEALEPDEEG